MRQSLTRASSRVGVLAVGLLLLAPATAYACACCADPGTWFQTAQRTSAFERRELSRIRLGPAARLSVGAAGIDAVKGIVDPVERYSISFSLGPGRWLLRFRDASSKTGTLAFAVPRTTVVFGVDPRDGRRAAAGGPVLYKEWRLTGPVTASGAFAPGARGARFRLILQGRGNVCLNAAQFTHWRLEVSGRNARYAFFGSLRRPAPA